MKETAERYEKLDGLRAFSAIGILLMHVQANGNYVLNGFLFEKVIPSFTNLVFLFMIISAFSMCCGYYEKILSGTISLEQFYKKRFIKVWPFFACLNLLDLAISPSIRSMQDIIANLSMCFGLIPNNGITVIGVGWFLGLVFVFYFLFPFFCFLLSNKRRAWFSAGLALLLNYLCDVRFCIGRENIIFSAVFFLIGGLIYLYRKELQQLASRYGWLLTAFLLLSATLYYMSGTNVPIMLILFGLLLIYAIKPVTGKLSILCNPVVRKISAVSMEIYLSHMVVFRVLEKLRMTHLFTSDVLSYVVMSLLTVVGTIAFSLLANCVLQHIVSKFSMA